TCVATAQAGSAGRGGVGLQPGADGKDGLLLPGRDTLGEGVVGPDAVVDTFDAVREVAAPPLVEPERRTIEGDPDGLDRATSEAKSDGALARRKFVLHGYLRGAAAGGCPRRVL